MEGKNLGIVVVVLLSLFAFVPRSIQAKTYPCSSDQLNELKEIEKNASLAAETLLQTITDRIDHKDSSKTPLSKNDLYKLMRARGVLTCASKKIGKLRYWCSNSSDYSAMTMWLFGKRIYLSDRWFWTGSDSYQASTLVHEYTHKCGAGDAAYFGDSTVDGHGVPRDVAGGMYYSIASTYDYWIDHGFCVPSIDC